ncbi:MAG: serine/threonine-protein kinase [Phycisphaerae bacterium]
MSDPRSKEPIPPGDDGDARAEQIGALLNEYLDRQRAGEALSVDDFVASHPDCAAELRQHLAGVRMIGGLSGVGGGSSDADRTHVITPGSGSSAPPRERVRRPDERGLPQIDGYEVQRELGRGGMGVVFRALQKSTKRAVALKVLLEGPFASDSARRRFEREIELAAQLRHPNIVPIYDSGSCDGRMYYAMEYVHGRTLDDYLRTDGGSVENRLRLFLKVCLAISHAHLRGVVHRDLKPANVLVDAEGEPRILDFGLAKAGGMRDANMSMTAQIVGTPAYMAPEQVAGDPMAIDMRTDVYGLGVMLYEMLCGAMPYPTQVALGEVLHNIVHVEPQRPSRVKRELSDELETILLKALQKKREARYQSVAALGDDVRRFLEGEPIAAKRDSATYLIGKALWMRRYTAAAVGTIVILVGVALGMAWRWSSAEQRRKLEQALAEKRQVEDRFNAERELNEAVQRKNDEFTKFLAKKVQDMQLSPEATKKLFSGVEDVVRDVGRQKPTDVLLKLGAAGLGQLGQTLEQSIPSATQAAAAGSQPSSDEAEDAAGP